MSWPRSLRFRYSLRALAIFLTLFCLWGGYHANRGWRERHAERVLFRHGASIEYWTGESRSFVIGTPLRLYWKLVGWLWGDRLIRSIAVTGPLDSDMIAALAA